MPRRLLAKKEQEPKRVSIGLACVRATTSLDRHVFAQDLYYPGGSPQTASDYPLHGGFVDIYGLLFDMGGGKVVDFWSNGDSSVTGTGHIDYGVAVATPTTALDYVGGGVSITPEPSALALLAGGLLAMLVWRRRVGRQRSLEGIAATAEARDISIESGDCLDSRSLCFRNWRRK